MGTLRPNKYSKYHKKYSKSIDPKTQHEKDTIQDPPKPQKVWFYYTKTHVFTDPPYPKKVTKMTPKCSPNGSKIDPRAPKDLSSTSKRRTENGERKRFKKH